jgi:membrane protein implicated in regulation of membrane protease activity
MGIFGSAVVVGAMILAFFLFLVAFIMMLTHPLIGLGFLVAFVVVLARLRRWEKRRLHSHKVPLEHTYVEPITIGGYTRHGQGHR